MKGQKSHTTPYYEGAATPDVTSIKNPDVSHEQGDMNISAVWKFGGGMIVAALVVFLIVYGVFSFLHNRVENSEPAASHIVKSANDRLPPEPRLQLAPGHEIAPQVELAQMEDSMRAVLDSYGWADQKLGVVRIPIDRAMDLLVQRGSLPVRTQFDSNSDAPHTYQGTMIPEFSSSGRMMIPRGNKIPMEKNKEMQRNE